MKSKHAENAENTFFPPIVFIVLSIVSRTEAMLPTACRHIQQMFQPDLLRYTSNRQV